MTQPAGFRAVLFDWRGTLVEDPPDEWWVGRALTRAGRAPEEAVVSGLCAALRTASELPEIAAGELTCDCSADLHREWSLSYFAAAGLDDELAAALYQLDLEAASHPFYSDAPRVLRALRDRGASVALVSDIHVDLRPEFNAAGLADCIDTFVLSFEHGIQKPDRRMFDLALDALDVDPGEALMVGDRASHDGGAIGAGITTWLVPPGLPMGQARGLDRILAVLG
jgi:HAD superfamily hydrolase (TIGR01509 family)